MHLLGYSTILLWKRTLRSLGLLVHKHLLLGRQLHVDSICNDKPLFKPNYTYTYTRWPIIAFAKYKNHQHYPGLALVLAVCRQAMGPSFNIAAIKVSTHTLHYDLDRNIMTWECKALWQRDKRSILTLPTMHHIKTFKRDFLLWPKRTHRVYGGPKHPVDDY